MMSERTREEIIREKIMGFVEEDKSGKILEVPVAVDLSQDIAGMHSLEINEAYRELRSNRKLIGRFIIFFKKVVRRCLKFYLEPVCFQQTEYNKINTKFAEDVRTQLTENRKSIIHGLELIQEQSNMQYNQYNMQQRQLEWNQKQDEWVRTTEMQQRQWKIELKGVHLGETALKQRLNELDEKYAKVEERQNVLNLGYAELADMLDFFHKYKHVVTNDFNERYEVGACNMTTSQCGEDSIVQYVLYVLGYDLKSVKYLDLGANHAKTLSNTYALYMQEANGVLVEANPKLIPELRLYRSRDIIVNKCVSSRKEDKLKFYIFNGDGLSTPDYESAQQVLITNPALKIVETVDVDSISITELLEQYFEKGPDVINIDIEGEELQILREINLEKYRPAIFIIEVIPYKTTLVMGDKNKTIIDYMNDNGYTEYAFTGVNSIFVDKMRLEGAEENEYSI